MTEREDKLMLIAKEVLQSNKNLRAKLSGSLALSFMGIKLNREANDIDIVCEFICEYDNGFPVVPFNFRRKLTDGSASQVNAIQFENNDGVKIDFMTSEEKGFVFDELPICRIDNIISAKLNYYSNDLSQESKDKHLNDLRFIFNQNNFEITLK